MKKLLSILLSFGLLLGGCAPEPSAEDYAPDESGRLRVYTAHKEEVYGPIVKEFQARTGIWVEVTAGGTNELLERIAAESDAPVCDVMFGGGVESLAAYEDCFQPYTPADAGRLKSVGRSAEDLWTPFSSLPIVLIYHTKLVPEGEVTGWADLLDSRWKGKIAFADPNVSGSSYTAALTLLSCLPGDDWELLARFVENLDGCLLADSGDVVARVQSGASYLGVTLEETALKRISAGADIAIVYPEEGTSAVPDGSALVRGAPHPDNARAFLDFVLGHDVQELVVSELSRRSVRSDIPDPDTLTPEREMGIIPYDVHWAGELKETFIRRWTELSAQSADQEARRRKDRAGPARRQAAPR